MPDTTKRKYINTITILPKKLGYKKARKYYYPVPRASRKQCILVNWTAINQSYLVSQHTLLPTNCYQVNGTAGIQRCPNNKAPRSKYGSPTHKKIVVVVARVIGTTRLVYESSRCVFLG
jgi:hypothetical protein